MTRNAEVQDASPVMTGLGHDNNERLLPSGRQPASGDPKELVEETEFGLGMPALQHRELLPEPDSPRPFPGVGESNEQVHRTKDEQKETWATVIADRWLRKVCKP